MAFNAIGNSQTWVQTLAWLLNIVCDLKNAICKPWFHSLVAETLIPTSEEFLRIKFGYISKVPHDKLLLVFVAQSRNG